MKRGKGRTWDSKHKVALIIFSLSSLHLSRFLPSSTFAFPYISLSLWRSLSCLFFSETFSILSLPSSHYVDKIALTVYVQCHLILTLKKTNKKPSLDHPVQSSSDWSEIFSRTFLCLSLCFFTFHFLCNDDRHTGFLWGKSSSDHRSDRIRREVSTWKITACL